MRHNPNDIITADAETFYSTEYSLSLQNYNTSSYIRDKQFKEHCWAIKLGKKPVKGYTAADGIKVLQDQDWSKKAFMAHNTSFDGLIIAHHHGIVPHYYYDTMSMTRGLHNEVSRAKLDTIAQFYAIGAKSKTYLTPTKGKRDLSPAIYKALLEGCMLDTDLCYQVGMKQLEIYPEDELDLIDMTIRMFCDPVLQIDEPLAKQALADEMVARLSEILKARNVFKTKGGKGQEVTEAELMSNPKFAKLLELCDVTPPTKISSKTGLENFAFAQTDPEFIELLEHEDKRVVLLTKGRLAAKSTQAETRAYRLLQAGENGSRLPVGYNYFGAKTGRWSGTNKLNLQNLPRVNPKEPKPSDGLRRSIIAPHGHVLVVTDSAQIEARLNAWFCGQTDVVEVFASKGDPYCHMAEQIYLRPIDKEIDKLERFIGKIAVLGLGYSMGHKKFQTTLAIGVMGPEVDISLAEAQRIVKLYRARNHKIAAMWKHLDTVLANMAADKSGFIKGAVELEYDPMTIWLPNGMGLHYPDLHMGHDGSFKYKANGVWKKIYGGLLLENCIAKDTLVLTNAGWCPIQDISAGHLIHDGVKFVSHGGLLNKSVQPCITIDGVQMTADHEVLTDDGWKAASQFPRPYRPEIRATDRLTQITQHREILGVGVEVRLREHSEQTGKGSNEITDERTNPKLRMPDQEHTTSTAHNARHVITSSIRSVAQHVRPLSTAVASSVGKLRRAWHNSVRRVAEEFSNLLGQHGSFISAGTGLGQTGQQRAVLAGELQMGSAQSEYSKQTELRQTGRCDFTSSKDRTVEVDDILSPSSRMDYHRTQPATEAHKQVYDIVNCGPRQRFVVLGKEGPFIVHNCIQALARIVVGEQMLTTQKMLNSLKIKKTEKARVVLMTHDEIVSCVPERFAAPILKDQLQLMRAPCHNWGDNIPLDADGGWAKNYSK